MSIFKGNLHSRKKEFHVFTTSDFALSELGLANYTLSSISAYLSDNEKTKNVDVELFFGGQLNTVKESLLGQGEISEGGYKILHFDKTTLSYVEQSNSEVFSYTKNDGTIVSNVGTNIQNFLVKYDLAMLTNDSSILGSNREDILNVAKKIQSSYSGCITFNARYTALGCTNNPLIKLHLLSKDDSSDDRVVAQKGSPIIVDVPKRISGASYGRAGTDRLDIGVYENQSEGGINNPNNSVAAPLDTRFNKATGKWQAGTHQILARLTTSVDSANTRLVSGFVPDLSSYDTSSANYVGQFSIGKAVPLSMENGNPYMYGPNLIGCSGSIKKVEEILVVNRSNRTFKAGDVVLASNIEGEWIIQGFDIPESVQKTGVGRWQFQKYIVNTDNFFRDERFKYEDGTEENQHAGLITPDIYQYKMRLKYYIDLYIGKTDRSSSSPDIIEISKYNIFPHLDPDKALETPLPEGDDYDLQLSNSFYQSSAFDQLSSILGGTNEANLLGRTNIFRSPDPAQQEDGLIYGKDMHNFWGPTFPDGYTANSCGVLKQKENIPIKITTNNNNDNKFFVKDQTLSLKDDTKIIDEKRRLFYDKKDANFLQLPAEVALNGSFKGKYSYPIERISIPISEQERLPIFFASFLTNKERFSYLQYEDEDEETGVVNSGDVYALSPNKPNVIQFSPLQLELALADVNIAPGALQDLNFVDLDYRTKVGHKFYTGNGDKKILSMLSVAFSNRNNLTTETLDAVAEPDPPQRGSSPFLFGPWVLRPKEPPTPLGGIGVIPTENVYSNEKSNLFGIIASKSRLSANPGSTINFKCIQYFGLTPRVTVTGGQGPNVTILGGFLSWGSPGNPIRQNSIPQWGDRFRSDNIYSTGTTALHVQIFDAWPEHQTFYDGRYFSVLHFNPFVIGGDAEVSESDNEKLQKKYSNQLESAIRKPNGVLSAQIEDNTGLIDETETSVDIKEPTDINGITIPLETVIDKNTVFRPKNIWNINPIRRGKLLSGGGFKYFYRVVGINDGAITVADPGSRYEIGDKIKFPGGAVLEVTTINGDGGIGNYKVIDYGEGLVPIDFSGEYKINDRDYVGLKNTAAETSSGSGAIIIISSGKVLKKFGLDEGPKQRCPTTKITSGSNNGESAIEETITTSITVDGGTGNYDAFYFMHNDILHTLLEESAFTPGFAQYIVLDIGSS